MDRQSIEQVKYPMDLIASRGWYITLPTKIHETPDTIEVGGEPDLMTYADEYFHLNAAGNGVVFVAPTNGATTKKSKHPRSELREMTSDGQDKAAWSSTSGTHSMEIDQCIDVVPIGSTPIVVVGQIHNSEDDVTVFRFEGNTSGDRTKGTLWITDGDSSHGYLVDDNFAVGTRFRVGFQVKANKINYTYNGKPVAYTQSKEISGCYFKAGSYCQSGGNVTPLPNGEPDYAQVTIYALQVCHDGRCTGNVPVEPPVDPPPVDLQPIVEALKTLVTSLQGVIVELTALKIR